MISEDRIFYSHGRSGNYRTKSETWDYVASKYVFKRKETFPMKIYFHTCFSDGTSETKTIEYRW